MQFRSFCLRFPFGSHDVAAQVGLGPSLRCSSSVFSAHPPGRLLEQPRLFQGRLRSSSLVLAPRWWRHGLRGPGELLGRPGHEHLGHAVGGRDGSFASETVPTFSIVLWHDSLPYEVPEGGVRLHLCRLQKVRNFRSCHLVGGIINKNKTKQRRT